MSREENETTTEQLLNLRWYPVGGATQDGAFNTPRLSASDVGRRTVRDRWQRLDRGWKATIVGVWLAAAVELAVRAGLL